MYKIALVNMPFAGVHLPSIALTQLRSVVQASFDGKAQTRLCYLNHDFVRYLDPLLYSFIATVEGVTSGLGDWFFRDVAFPGLPDNSEQYLRRHFSERQEEREAMGAYLLEKRRTVEPFLDELIDRYELDSHDLVGFTSMFSQNAACFAMARKLKQRNPKIVTVIGGANCEASMGRVIARQIDAIDFVFSGAALKSFPEFIGRRIAGDEAGCHRIVGVLSREKLANAAGAAGLRHEIGEELDIDVDVPLDYEDFFASLHEKIGPGAPGQVVFETSRGCWWGERAHCTFCGLNGMTMKYRAMQPEKALRLIEHLIEKYGDRASRYQCIDNIMPREYLTDVFPHLRPPKHISIFYEVKADLKDREMEVLAQAGVTEIQPGIEALATTTLRLMKKGTTAFQNLRFLKSCLVHGIEPLWNLLLGFPGEEEGVYRKYFDDLPLLAHLPPPTGAYPVRFDRFSPYHTQPQEYGLKLKPYECYSMIYPFDAESLDDLAYFFVDQTFSADYLRQTADWIARLRQRIEHWHTRWGGADGGIKPQLFLDTSGGTPVVYDSRTGREVRHEIGEPGLRILALLDRQARPSWLADQLGDLSLPEVEREIEALADLGLLFREEDLYMSLVTESRMPATLPVLAQGDAVEQFNFA
jgi:ribosomal peptide maturation radical SAM protein 1